MPSAMDSLSALIYDHNISYSLHRPWQIMLSNLEYGFLDVLLFPDAHLCLLQDLDLLDGKVV